MHSEATAAAQVKTYYVIYAALLGLLVATVVVGQFPLGHWHLAAALLIAFVKTGLIVVYFMHLRWNQPLTIVAIIAGLVCLATLFTLTGADVASRMKPNPKPKQQPDAVSGARSAEH